MSTEHLRFAPDILSRLGEELIPHPDQGMIELVRNSYDADAVNCTVELIDTQQPGGTLRIIDDGIGMASHAIVSGWLVVGRSTKSEGKRTKRFRRLPVGPRSSTIGAGCCNLGMRRSSF